MLFCAAPCTDKLTLTARVNYALDLVVLSTGVPVTWVNELPWYLSGKIRDPDMLDIRHKRRFFLISKQYIWKSRTYSGADTGGD